MNGLGDLWETKCTNICIKQDSERRRERERGRKTEEIMAENSTAQSLLPTLICTSKKLNEFQII